MGLNDFLDKLNYQIIELSYIIVSLILATLIAYLNNKNPILEKSLIIMFISLLIIGLVSEFLSLSKNLRWRVSYKIRLHKKIIAIIREEECEREYTRFIPENWFNYYKEKGYNAEYIKVNEIKGKYLVIINPYGEVYPEEDLVNLKTLKMIKNYVDSGGIFINAGGCPFYYGWHTEYKKKYTLPKEMQSYKIEENSFTGEKILIPIILKKTPSLVDTPLHDFFKVNITFEGSKEKEIFQKEVDIGFVGDLKTEDKSIVEFRAVREPAPHCIPFIRSKNEVKDYESYPIAGIKSVKGCLIIAGINLNSNRGKDYDYSQFEIVNESVINYINYLCKNHKILKK